MVALHLPLMRRNNDGVVVVSHRIEDRIADATAKQLRARWREDVEMSLVSMMRTDPF